MLKYILPIFMPWFGADIAPSQSCQRVVYQESRYIICSYKPESIDLRLFHADPATGKPLRNFGRLRELLDREGKRLVFAMNGGMYHSDMSPVGLYIENGLEKVPLVTASGWGNFHLLPNGVFYIKDGKPVVQESFAFERAGVSPDFATQSGPMLVIDGVLHPKFLADSDSFKIRNGVGVADDGALHFVISEDRVRFYDFAVLFRDRLNVRNALYLDGTISSVDIPEIGRSDRLFPMGPMIGIITQKVLDE